MDVKVICKLEKLEEGKKAGNTTHHFRQGIAEARDNAFKYCEFLKKEYQSVVDSVEGKKVDNMNVMKEIKKNTATCGNKQQSLVFQLNTLRAEREKNKTTPEEEQLYEEFV